MAGSQQRAPTRSPRWPMETRQVPVAATSPTRFQSSTARNQARVTVDLRCPRGSFFGWCCSTVDSTRLDAITIYYAACLHTCMYAHPPPHVYTHVCTAHPALHVYTHVHSHVYTQSLPTQGHRCGTSMRRTCLRRTNGSAHRRQQILMSNSYTRRIYGTYKTHPSHT